MVPRLQPILALNLSVPWTLSSLEASMDLAITTIRNLQRNIAGVFVAGALLPDSHACCQQSGAVRPNHPIILLSSFYGSVWPDVKTSLEYFRVQGIEDPEEQLIPCCIKGKIQIQIQAY